MKLKQYLIALGLEAVVQERYDDDGVDYVDDDFHDLSTRTAIVLWTYDSFPMTETAIVSLIWIDLGNLIR